MEESALRVLLLGGVGRMCVRVCVYTSCFRYRCTCESDIEKEKKSAWERESEIDMGERGGARQAIF